MWYPYQQLGESPPLPLLLPDQRPHPTLSRLPVPYPLTQPKNLR